MLRDMKMKAELILDSKSILGEGAFWNSETGSLHWVDIEGKKLHEYDPTTGLNKTLELDGRPGTVVPCRTSGVVAAVERSIMKFPGKSDRTEIDAAAAVDPVEICFFNEEPQSNRLNDGKCDPAGRLWVGTISEDRSPTATLYRVEPDGSFKAMLKSVTVSNGIVWTADERTMYYIDTPTGCVQAFDYHKDSGEISRPRIAFRIPEDFGHPDGMTIDSESMLWIALFRGCAVRRFDPGNGALLATVELPVSNVTSCALGGPDLQDLYITTARSGLNQDAAARQPAAGGLFHARVEVCGIPQPLFAD